MAKGIGRIELSRIMDIETDWSVIVEFDAWLDKPARDHHGWEEADLIEVKHYDLGGSSYDIPDLIKKPLDAMVYEWLNTDAGLEWCKEQLKHR